MKRRQQSLLLTWSGLTSSLMKWRERERESENSITESEAVYIYNHHDCDEVYNEPISTTSELADSERKLDKHGLACSLKKVRALRPVNVTRAECYYARNETETVCSRLAAYKSVCRTSAPET